MISKDSKTREFEDTSDCVIKGAFSLVIGAETIHVNSSGTALAAEAVTC